MLWVGHTLPVRSWKFQILAISVLLVGCHPPYDVACSADKNSKDFPCPDCDQSDAHPS